jgi:hypothetical protein
MHQDEPIEAGNWQDEANCLGVDPDLFFPERGASTREAKEVCRGCVVRLDCLEYALSNGEKFPPEEAEAALLDEPAFEQVMLVGEGRHFLTLLCVTQETDEKTLVRLANQQLKDFPRYVRVRRAIAVKSVSACPLIAVWVAVPSSMVTVKKPPRVEA